MDGQRYSLGEAQVSFKDRKSNNKTLNNEIDKKKSNLRVQGMFFQQLYRY